MKIAIITDQHYGIRNDSPIFYDYQKKFNDIFFDTLKERNITQIINLGDLFDRKKYINYVTANRCRSDFLSRIQSNDLYMDIIAGNHDIYYKNTQEINSLMELIDGKYSNIGVYYNPLVKEYDGVPILLIPWICASNYDYSMYMINKSKTDIAFGHLELNGFEMYKGIKNDHGLDPEIFKRYDIVASGHYHHKSTVGNINYLGAAYEFYWSDYNDDRGFHIFDTDTRNFEFIKNPYSMFNMLVYDDTKTIDLNSDLSYLENTYVKILSMKKTQPHLFDQFLDRIYKVSPLDITVIEDINSFNENANMIETVDESENTLSVLHKYIDGLTIDLDSNKLKKTMEEIYWGALSLEETDDN